MDDRIDNDHFDEDEPFAPDEDRIDADDRMTQAQELFQQAYEF